MGGWEGEEEGRAQWWYRRGRLLTQRGFHPGKFYVQAGAFWDKIALDLIISKLQY